MQRQLVLASCLLILGVALLFGSFLWKGFGPKSQLGLIGTVQTVMGNAYLQDEIQKKPLTEKTELREGNLVLTGEISQARVQLENGAQLLLLADTVVSFEKSFQGDKWSFVAKVFSGELQVESPGQPAVEKVLASETLSWPEKLIIGAKAQNSPPEVQTPSENLGQNRPQGPEISQKLQQKRRDFLRCFAQLLQRTPTAKGSAQLSFTILPTGKVVQPNVRSDDLSEVNFKNCLSEVAQRIRFSNFSGDAVLAQFPLVFE